MLAFLPLRQDWGFVRPQGWLVDLVNRFGQLDGFSILLERFTKGPSLSVPLVASLIK